MMRTMHQWKVKSVKRSELPWGHVLAPSCWWGASWVRGPCLLSPPVSVTKSAAVCPVLPGPLSPHSGSGARDSGRGWAAPAPAWERLQSVARVRQWEAERLISVIRARPSEEINTGKIRNRQSSVTEFCLCKKTNNFKCKLPKSYMSSSFQIENWIELGFHP